MDEDEKSVQIKLMYRIYHRERQVWVRLGRATEQTPEAIDLLPRLREVADQLTPSYKKRSFSSFQLPEPECPVWDEVCKLLANKWFGRLWVVQVSFHQCSPAHGHMWNTSQIP